tara:strand:- start:157 stop:474 length:318 start_codon:yes stop_codon:yes gene_type:complete
MPLPGYPKTKHDHTMHLLETGESTTAESGGHYTYIQVQGNDATDWVTLHVKMPNTSKPDEIKTIKVTVGTSLSGPFTYVKHHAESDSGGIDSTRDCWTQVYELEA